MSSIRLWAKSKDSATQLARNSPKSASKSHWTRCKKRSLTGFLRQRIQSLTPKWNSSILLGVKWTALIFTNQYRPTLILSYSLNRLRTIRSSRREGSPKLQSWWRRRRPTARDGFRMWLITSSNSTRRSMRVVRYPLINLNSLAFSTNLSNQCSSISRLPEMLSSSRLRRLRALWQESCPCWRKTRKSGTPTNPTSTYTSSRWFFARSNKCVKTWLSSKIRSWRPSIKFLMTTLYSEPRTPKQHLICRVFYVDFQETKVVLSHKIIHTSRVSIFCKPTKSSRARKSTKSWKRSRELILTKTRRINSNNSTIISWRSIPQ